MHKISFPGLGIGEFEIDSIALRLGSLEVAWYGVIITTGIFLAFLYIYLRGKKIKLIADDLVDLAFFAVIPGIIGARLYYVFFDWLERPQNYTSFKDIIAIWEGGLAIYGGIIFGALGCIIGLKIKKMRIPAFFDLLAPAVQIAQTLGRWGNFMNAEAYGAETKLPWRMRIVDAYNPVGIEVHPTFLYESLWNLIGFILINLYAKKKKFDGELLLMYLGWYGLGRAIIEGLRQDSLYLGSLRVSQWLALLCTIVSIALLCYFYFIKKLRYVADCIYLPGAKSYAAVCPSPAEAVAVTTASMDESTPAEESADSPDPQSTDSKEN